MSITSRRWWRSPVAVLSGVVTGGVLAAVVAIGEFETRLAAGGGLRGIGPSDVILVAPQWSVVVAAATVLVAGGLLAGAWELTRRAGRLFWIAAAVPLVVVIAVGTTLAPELFDPARPLSTEVLGGAAHSGLLFAVLALVILAAVRRSPDEEVTSS